jgi:hypothetical protein
MPVLILANESAAARRRVFFHCVDVTDGITPETGEASGQPQISTNGAAFTDTGIGTLTHIGNGRYYADLTQSAVATAGDAIETRYKSANTAETPGDSVRVVAFNPYDAVRMGLTALPNAAADGAGGLPVSDAGGLDLDAMNTAAVRLTAARAQVLDDWINGGRLDLILDAVLDDTDLIDDAASGLAKIATDVAAILVDTGTTLPATLATIAGYLDTEVAAILADTNELQADWADGGRLDLLLDAILQDTGTSGVVLSAAQMNKIADHVLRRTYANAEASSDGDTIVFRSLIGAIAKLVNKIAVSGSTLTVYKDDDATPLGTQAVTSSATADPITELDTT